MRRISGIAACAAQTGGQSTQDPPLYATRRFESYDSVPAGSPISLNNVRKFEADGLQVAVCVAQGGRPYQEDSWLVMSKEPPRNSNGWWFSAGQPPAPPATTSTGIEQPTILAVFDGHGGAECSRFLTQEFPALFEGASSSDDPLLSALLAVDEPCEPWESGLHRDRALDRLAVPSLCECGRLEGHLDTQRHSGGSLQRPLSRPTPRRDLAH
jgi:hypothetical protein